MPSAVYKYEPNSDKLLKLRAEEIAPYFFHDLYETEPRPFSLKNAFLNDKPAVDYPAEHRKKICDKLMEAWKYLDRWSMVIPNPGSDSGWYTFSITATQLGTADALKVYIAKEQQAEADAYARVAAEAQDMKARAPSVNTQNRP